MAGKTNKSYTKRLKITKKGKLLSRVPGQNHFKARQTRRKQLNRKGFRGIGALLTQKVKQQFLPHERI